MTSLLHRACRLLLFLLVLLPGAAVPPAAAAVAPATPPANATADRAIEAFVREGCPHCAQAEAFLDQLAREDPGLRIVIRDVSKEPAAMERLKQLARDTPGAVARVPAVYVGRQLILGYSTEARTDRLIRGALAGERATHDAATLDTGSCSAEDDSLSCEAAPAAETFEITVFGRTLSLDDVGLPAFAFVMGLLDGFNPCSMWVLILMISLLAPLNDRRRMLAIAGTFVAVEGISYFLMMTAWLNLFLLIGLARWSEVALGLLALAYGLVNVKDFFAFGRGFTLSISERNKADIYRRMRAVLATPSMGAAVAGTIVLGILVQIVEFMCTSGFPALFTRILTLRALDTASYYGYMLLYNAAYMLDDVIVLGIGVVTLSRHRLQEKQGRWLKLLAGVVMIGLAVYLLVP
ncbi:MAG TPA: glutaredoxin domain-containing protein [Casimicrobiaceae bacterium]|nr:glutaredoxin domain-containing protein [Casimicrobiaceae bacterium]